MHWARSMRKPFAASGMDKVSDQVVVQSTWDRLVGFVIRSGFPATQIESDGIRVPAGQVVTYAATIRFSTAPGTGNTSSGRVVDGSTVIESKSNSATGTSLTFSGTFVGTGQLVTLEGYSTSTGGRGTVVASSTYLTLTP